MLYSLKNNGFSENTLKPIGERLRLLSKNADLNNPTKVKEFIANQNWENSFKQNVIYAYNHYVKINGLQWQMPRYQVSEKSRRLPLEQDIDAIISRARQKYQIIYRLMKENGLRPIEVSRLKLRNVDLEQGIIDVPTAKGGVDRQQKLKSQTLAMLKSYVNPHFFNLGQKIFPCVKSIKRAWCEIRKSTAKMLSKQSLLMIRLYDLRHFYGSRIYYQTKDIVYTQRCMGHKNIKNTLRYIHLINFTSEEYACKIALNVPEATQLIEQGFQYVCEIEGVKLFRKPK